ncbi:MAG: hypothetical protein K5770_11210 [Lachnospiraceae bacterium]|nr:hypothetical protein [Lachnospiraceae bacterium]
MKNRLTNNLGLKIISLLAAFILWMIVVNTDDPMITRTYSGIPVEVINTEEIISQGKTFEILDNTDTISVIVHAKRSIIEDMSRDYIRAAADMREISASNTIPIEVRSTRFSDRIESLTPVTRNVRVEIEDMGTKRLRISVDASGKPEEGYVAGDAVPSVNIMTVSGPASIVDRIAYARAIVDVSGLKSDVSTSAKINLYDEDWDIIPDGMLDLSVSEVHVDVKILETKTVTINYGHITGLPAEGYQTTGAVSIVPEVVQVAGSGDEFNKMEFLTIPDDVISVAGAAGNAVMQIDMDRYLPEGVIFADPDYDGVVTVTVYIGNNASREINIPSVNISITNVPEGYSAIFADMGGYRTATVYGLSDKVSQVDGNTVTGSVNATSAIPPELIAQGVSLHGSYSGQVQLNLPSGVSVVEPVYIDFILNPISASIPGGEMFIEDNSAEPQETVLPDINNEITQDIEEQPVETPEVTITEGEQ